MTERDEDTRGENAEAQVEPDDHWVPTSAELRQFIAMTICMVVGTHAAGRVIGSRHRRCSFGMILGHDHGQFQA